MAEAIFAIKNKTDRSSEGPLIVGMSNVRGRRTFCPISKDA
jgi:hypothetical protein